MSTTLAANPMSNNTASNTEDLFPVIPIVELATSWEDRVAELLGELSQVQSYLLAVLGTKSGAIAKGDLESLAACTGHEEQLLLRLEQCHVHREQLLAAAREEGRPATTVEDLALSLDGPRRHELRQGVTDARRRMRLLQHHSLTNWVVTQRTLIHLSQMIEIVATGGKLNSIYGRPEAVASSGGFVDHQA